MWVAETSADPAPSEIGMFPVTRLRKMMLEELRVENHCAGARLG